MLENQLQGLNIEDYKQEISAYKNYRTRVSILKEELSGLEKKKKTLAGASFLIAYGISLPLTFLLFFDGGGQEDFWGSLVVSIFFAIYPAAFFGAIFDTDFLNNIFSFGKLDKIKKLQKDVQAHIEEAEELKGNTYKKLQPFEKAIRDYYETQLAEFFDKNLFKKRSGGQGFEEALSEFSSTIEELSPINSSLVTTRIPLEDYREYLKKRTINHNLQVSKKSEGLTSIRNFTRKFTELQEQRRKEVVAPEKLYRTARKINWENINKTRKLTGEKGEEIAVAIEQEFFESIGRKDLANRVRNVAAEDGDGLGYDVLSFFEDGRDKYIEVKSTKTSLTAPFYISRNELGFLKEHNQDAFIYRILVSGEDSQIRTQLGSEFLETNELIPTQYIARVK